MPEPFVADPFLTVTIGFIVFFVGALLTRSVRFLRDFSIPESVAGGSSSRSAYGSGVS